MANELKDASLELSKFSDSQNRESSRSSPVRSDTSTDASRIDKTESDSLHDAIQQIFQKR
jgi:hypothetical protein